MVRSTGSFSLYSHPDKLHRNVAVNYGAGKHVILVVDAAAYAKVSLEKMVDSVTPTPLSWNPTDLMLDSASSR